jgi:hypothetical protein
MSENVIFQQNLDSKYIHSMPARKWIEYQSRTEIKEWMHDAGFVYGRDYGRCGGRFDDWEPVTMSLWFSRASASTLEWFLMRWG